MRSYKVTHALFFFIVLGSTAAAWANPAHLLRVLPRVLPRVHPIVRTIAAPRGIEQRRFLAQLPPLPRESLWDTARPRVRRMAANGDSIDITTVTGCGGDQGQMYAVGCTIDWQFNGAVSVGADQLEDCYAPSDQPNAVADCSAPYSGAPPTEGPTTLSTSGTWVFGTLDVTKNQWLDVVYLPVGSTVVLDTFSDQFDTDESGSFTAVSGTNVYIKATGLPSGSDRYEVYVEYTSADAACVYTAPAESPAASAGSLCNPANDSGDLTASSGILQATWPLSSADAAGTYSIVVWDVTAGSRLAQREVTLSSSGGGTLSIVPAGGNASPNPNPAGTPGATFAFDDAADASDGSLRFSAANLGYSGSIILTLSDPTGQVIKSWTGHSTGGSYAGKTWTLASADSSSNYPLDTWTATIASAGTGAVLASQAFRIVGYQVQTQFVDPVSTAVTMSTQPATTAIEFTNTAATAYGSGNGDAVSAIQFSDGKKGIVLTLLDGTASTTGVCAGAASCQTETVPDTNGVVWSIDNYCSGTGSRESCAIDAVPAVAGSALATGASLVLSDVQYAENVANVCPTGCTATTSILPQDGLTWSPAGSTAASNDVYFTEGKNGATYSAQGHVYLYGYRDASGTLHAGKEAHGYSVRALSAGETSVTYTSTSPSSSGTAKLVYELEIANDSSAGTAAIKKFDVTLPAAFSQSIAGATVDASSPSAWKLQTCATGTAADTLCLKHATSNSGIPAGGQQTLYIDVTPPASSVGYTDATIEVTSPSKFPVAADGSWTIFTGASAGTKVDSTALVGYSLSDAYMSVATSPQSMGENTTQTIAFTITNTTFAGDDNPDYLDAIVVAVPTANALSNISVSNAGWSDQGSYTVGGDTYVVFGLCSAQASAAYGPPNDGMPSCGQTTEQDDAIAPGGSLSFTATVTSGTGNVAMTMYAHGANGNGWSAGKTFTETVTAISVDAGFSAVGASPAPAIPSGSTPAVGADTTAGIGNDYVYTFRNTSGSGASNDVTSLTITVPGEDVSDVNGADASGKAWTITSAPTLSGSGFSGCSVTSYSSATSSGGNGAIVIGGSSCSLAPGGVMNVNFTAQAPYRVNDTYLFAASATSGATSVPVTQTWTNDAEMEIVLSASIAITIDPSANANAGTNPTPICTGCTFTLPNAVDMGTIANGSFVLGSDVAEVDVSTDACSPEGWKLYVSASVNPSNTAGTYPNELVAGVDSAASLSGAGVNYDQTSLAVIPTSASGLLLADTGSGTAPRRNPFGIVMDYEIYIDGGPVSSQDAVLTYTFIAN